MPAAPSSKSDVPKIIVRGAREHNLKNVSIEIPRDRLVVFTGLSGSGKSSLAFDTIYAEVDVLAKYVERLLATRFASPAAQPTPTPAEES